MHRFPGPARVMPSGSPDPAPAALAEQHARGGDGRVGAGAGGALPVPDPGAAGQRPPLLHAAGDRGGDGEPGQRRVPVRPERGQAVDGPPERAQPRRPVLHGDQAVRRVHRWGLLRGVRVGAEPLHHGRGEGRPVTPGEPGDLAAVGPGQRPAPGRLRVRVGLGPDAAGPRRCRWTGRGRTRRRCIHPSRAPDADTRVRVRSPAEAGLAPGELREYPHPACRVIGERLHHVGSWRARPVNTARDGAAAGAARTAGAAAHPAARASVTAAVSPGILISP